MAARTRGAAGVSPAACAVGSAAADHHFLLAPRAASCWRCRRTAMIGRRHVATWAVLLPGCAAIRTGVTNAVDRNDSCPKDKPL
jgi:hypothetical protein